MSYTVEYDDNAPDYRSVVIRIDGRHRCGYVSVPAGHPWHGLSYAHEVPVEVDKVAVNHSDLMGTFLAIGRENHDKLPIGYLMNVHGGVTYAEGTSIL
jgi:hypothetical protein